MTIVIAAGGTGGHLYPAIALAREFLRRDPATRIVFVGTGRGIESKVLAHEGFELAIIVAQPVMGRSLWRAAGALLALPMGFWQARSLLRAHRATLVLGVGGYTSPPVLLAAAWLGLPRAILEPNAYPGTANRALDPFVHRVFLAFGEAASHFASKAEKVLITGTPVRRAFFSPSPTLPQVGGGSGWGRKTLLVFGGSQGARAINDAMIAALPHLAGLRSLMSVVHQTGDADHERVQAAYGAAGFQADVVPFVFEMPRTLRAADLVVSRAGAVTVAELTVCGKPAVLIPLPHAIHQHQAHNAQVLADAGGAVVLPQHELTGQRLAQELAALFGNPERLRMMGERSRALGRPDSADVIVRECLKLVKREA